MKLILFIILFTTFSLFKSDSEHSLESVISLKEGLNTSVYFKNFTQKMKMHMDQRKFYESDLKDYSYQKDCAVNETCKISLPSKVGSTIETLEFFPSKLLQVETNLTLILEKDYGYDIVYPENLQSPYKRNIKYTSEFKDVIDNFTVYFMLNQPKIAPVLQQSKIETLSSFVVVENVIIGINSKDSSLFIFIYEKTDLIGLAQENIHKLFIHNPNITDLDLSEKKLKNILLDSNKDKKNKKYLIISDEEASCYIYKIEIKSINDQNPIETLQNVRIEFRLLQMSKHLLLDTYRLIDFVENKGIHYFAYENYGIVIKNGFQLVKEIKKFPNNLGENIFLQVLDIQEVENAIYVLIENYGLKILDVSDPGMPKWSDFELFHPYLKKIEIHKNSYYTYSFLSIIVNNPNLDGHEFLFELSLEDEFNPKIFRYFLNPEYMDFRYIVSDDYYIYLFDHVNKDIFILSRSITSTSNNSVYKFQLPMSMRQDINNSPFIVNDSSFLNKHLAFLTVKGSFVFLKNIELKNAQLEIKFNKIGKYLLEFYTFTDFCGENIEEVQQCKVKVSYDFTVGNEKYEEITKMEEEKGIKLPDVITEKPLNKSKIKSILTPKVILLFILALLIICIATIILYWKKIKKFFNRVSPFFKFAETEGYGGTSQRTDAKYQQDNSIGIRPVNIELRNI
jgi:hypothetical protein